MKRSLASMFAAIALAGCQMPPKCAFSYNQETADRLILPAMKEKVGNLYKLYDLAKPGIVSSREIVKLVFVQSDKDVLDTPVFIVEVDPCARKVLRAYESPARI